MMIVGTVAGLTSGSTVAGWWLGITIPGLFSMSPQDVVPRLIVSASIRIAAMYFLSRRDRLTGTEVHVHCVVREAAGARRRRCA